MKLQLERFFPDVSHSYAGFPIGPGSMQSAVSGRAATGQSAFGAISEVVGNPRGSAAERVCRAGIGVAAVWRATGQAMSDGSKGGDAAGGGEREAFVLLDDSLGRDGRCWLFERQIGRAHV